MWFSTLRVRISRIAEREDEVRTVMVHPHADDTYGTGRPLGRSGTHAQEEHADYGNRRHAAQEDIPS
ncbi:hypothetical protein GCM10009803_07620 [Microbacterium ginsengiterrae]